jgi:Fe-S oxidoreductase
MAETMKLCVSCKGCRRECPTGVDMARMKIEVQAARVAQRGLSLHDRLVGYLPRYAPYAAKVPWLMNLRDALPGAAKVSELLAGFSASRPLPRWRSDVFREDSSWPGSSRPSTPSLPKQDVDARDKRGHDEVVLFADTFNRYFEPENLDAAVSVLTAAGYTVHMPSPADGSRPLCCGRTFLSVGLVDEARREAERTLAALAPFAERGVPIVGLEPSCVFGFRDEIPAMIRDARTERLAGQVLTFEEFLGREVLAGRFAPTLGEVGKRVMLHGHCHQKSFDVMNDVERVLALIPGLNVETVESSCCGMAGSFGYGADTIEVSRQMGERSLLPTVRKADADTIVVADGTSCRQQIRDGTGREALHVARVLAMSMRVVPACAGTTE